MTRIHPVEVSAAESEEFKGKVLVRCACLGTGAEDVDVFLSREDALFLATQLKVCAELLAKA